MDPFFDKTDNFAIGDKSTFVRQKQPSIISSFNSSQIKRREYIYKRYSYLEKYSHYDTFQLKILLGRQHKVLLYSDILCTAIDLVTICVLYFDNFGLVNSNYNDGINNSVTNKSSIPTHSNVGRIVCMVLGIFSAILIASRHKFKITYENLKYLLSMRGSRKSHFNNSL